jgi:hypothetical protein
LGEFQAKGLSYVAEQVSLILVTGAAFRHVSDDAELDVLGERTLGCHLLEGGSRLFGPSVGTALGGGAVLAGKHCFCVSLEGLDAELVYIVVWS